MIDYAMIERAILAFYIYLSGAANNVVMILRSDARLLVDAAKAAAISVHMGTIVRSKTSSRARL